MTEEKNTTYMRIKVDLQCPRCRKKIKKVLCKFPQIRDQVYNEKENYVVIKVVCCCPEKVKQKIICKGGVTITNIEIIKIEKTTKQPEKVNPPDKEKKVNPPDKEKKVNPPDEKKEEEKKKKEEKKKDSSGVSKPPPEPVCVPVRPRTCCTECYQGCVGGPCRCGHCTRLVPLPVPVPVPVPVPFDTCCTKCSDTCCTECSEGRDGGPCHYSHGRPTPCYDGCYCGRPICDSYVGRCEETSSGCTMM